MKNLFKASTLALAIMASAAVMTSCEKDKPVEQTVDTPPAGSIELKGTITDSLVLDASKKYYLNGWVYVAAPGSITIPAGTVIMGKQGTKASLVIERGAKIYANGTADKPVVFTSAQPAGQRNYGDWGGLIILGKAPNNGGASVTIEGGVERPYGGTDVNDNSGVLKYVRIEFGGIAISPGNEINGLTLGSVGAGTTIDYVQVSYSGDDAIEWFGGAVNAKHLVAHRTWDDDFDTDNGYSGKIQYGVALRDLNVADQSTSNGFESDNDANGSLKAPQTTAVFSNMSVFGHFKTISDTTGASALIGRGAHIRRNSSISIFNTVITGYREGIRLDSTITQANMTTGNLVLKNITLAGNVKGLETKGTADKTLFTNTFNDAANNNAIVTAIADLGLNADNFNLTAPNFLPTGSSSLLTSGSFSDSKLSGGFFDNVAFRGAFGTQNWTAGWANFNPQTATY